MLRSRCVRVSARKRAEEGDSVFARHIESFKSRVHRHLLYQAWLRQRENSALGRWARDEPNRPPPHLFKQYVVRSYAKRFTTPVLVETGTFLGQMVEAMAPYFEHIYSIELDDTLHRRAASRLAHLTNVTLHQGDSGDLLGRILQEIKVPCLLWLDGHYSAGATARGIDDSPIRRELEHVFELARLRDVLLIDDARCFDGRGGYPTLAEMTRLLRERARVEVTVAEDIIRVTPQ